MKKIIVLTSLGILFAVSAFAADSTTNAVATFPVTITVDAGKSLGELKPIWRMFGADEPNYATMKDGKKLLMEIGALRTNDMFFRAHNLLCTGDGIERVEADCVGGPGAGLLDRLLDEPAADSMTL